MQQSLLRQLQHNIVHTIFIQSQSKCKYLMCDQKQSQSHKNRKTQNLRAREL